jgi:hypothetical protein
MRSFDNSLREHALSRRVYAARLHRANTQPSRPHIELHRIAFTRRKTARATSLFGLTPRTRGSNIGEQRRSGIVRSRGRPGQRIASWQALKGTKPQERRPVIRRGLRECATNRPNDCPQKRRQRDRAGNVRFALAHWYSQPAGASNLPIGSAGPKRDGENVEAQPFVASMTLYVRRKG